MNETRKRRLIQLYFWSAKPWLKLSGWLLLVGFLLLWSRPGAWIFALGMVGVAGIAALVILRPDDQTIDRWLEEDLDRFGPKALAKLDLDEHDLERDPLRVVGPFLGQRGHAGSFDLHVRRGRDRNLRFSRHRLMILLLTEHHLGVYSCVFDSRRGLTFAVSNREHPYNLVAGVEVREDVEVFDGEEENQYKLKSGKTLVPTQSFIRSLTNGDRLVIPVRARTSDDRASGDPPATELDRTVTALRAMLHAKYQPA